MKKKNKKILIVEDNIEIANRLKTYLETIGYTISGIVAFGEDAIEIASEDLADLILMDINLAGEITGLKAAEIINSQFSIPIIFITANDDDTSLKEASKSNLYGYIIKPFDETELKITIEMAFYKHKIYLDQLAFFKNIEDLHETATRLQNCVTFDHVMKVTTGMARQFCQFNNYAVYKVNYNELDFIIGSYKPSLDNYEFNYIKKIAESTRDDGLPYKFGTIDETPIEPTGVLGFESGISAPIGDLGVFQLFSRNKNSFSEVHLKLLKLLLEHTFEALKRIQLEEELRDQAIRDPLTHAFNRFYLYKILEREKKLAKSEHRKLAFLMFDINNLKKINDNYGHRIGDNVIQIVSSIITKEKDNDDILIRYGGDEFLLVIQQPKNDLEEMENRILARNSKWNEDISDFDFKITFAIGSITWDSKDNKSLEDILINVDERMYINKQKQKEALK